MLQGSLFSSPLKRFWLTNARSDRVSESVLSSRAFSKLREKWGTKAQSTWITEGRGEETRKNMGVVELGHVLAMPVLCWCMDRGCPNRLLNISFPFCLPSAAHYLLQNDDCSWDFLCWKSNSSTAHWCHGLRSGWHSGFSSGLVWNSLWGYQSKLLLPISSRSENSVTQMN